MTQERAATARGAVVMETRSSQLPTTTPSGPRGFRPARWWRAGGSVRRGTPRRGFRAPRATQVRGRGTGEGPRDRRGAGAGQAAPRGGSGAAWPGRARGPRGSLRRLPRDEPTLARASLGEPASVHTLPGAGPHLPPRGARPSPLPLRLRVRPRQLSPGWVRAPTPPFGQPPVCSPHPEVCFPLCL